ncbi:hypothetical protein [Gordonia sihwensis]|uniref:hypothetical protein n=1 Tax=Gordonia sihwensis TaxID=173559 RepID=UPI003D95B47C
MGRIDEILAANGLNRGRLAARLGVDAKTVSRNLKSLKRDSLEAMASEIGIGYAALLRAALIDNGTISTLDDLFGDAELTIVGTPDREAGEIDIDGIFTTKAAADDYAEFQESLRGNAPRLVAQGLVLPTGTRPRHTTIDEITWRHSNDRLTAHSWKTSGIPTSWEAATNGGVEITCVSDGKSSGVTRISAQALDVREADELVTDTVVALRERGLLAPRDLDATPNGYMDQIAQAMQPCAEFTEEQITTRSWLDQTAAGIERLAAAARTQTISRELRIRELEAMRATTTSTSETVRQGTDAGTADAPEALGRDKLMELAQGLADAKIPYVWGAGGHLERDITPIVSATYRIPPRRDLVATEEK